MSLKIQATGDGSHTLFSEEFNEIYHSRHGAWQESQHVFIAAGLAYLMTQKEEINLLEIGFGTGLNAIQSLASIKDTSTSVCYWGIEPIPVGMDLIEKLNYSEYLLQSDLIDYFFALHQVDWNTQVEILPNFYLNKINQRLEDWQTSEMFDLVYFDAFAPGKHPALWQAQIFEKLGKMLRKDGVLVTYCAQGQFKRDLKQGGFRVEALDGPPGKRQMTRGIKE